ncbi:MAG: acyltransferase [Candidatus Fermentibacteraceae bacterium]
MVVSFYSDDELRDLGFARIGCDVKVSRKTSFYNIQRIEIGDHSRIDDFCVISCGEAGQVRIGNYVHISTHCFVVAPMEVVFEDFSGISSGCRIFGGSDDYSGDYLTNPCIPVEFRKCHYGPVRLGRHSVVGAGATILQGVTIGDCSAVGAMSLVLRDVPSSEIHAGVPAKFIKARSQRAYELEKMFLDEVCLNDIKPESEQRKMGGGF